ncbi:hypothetical protein EIP86_002840 [Pleurotus ostreatoroseus]|nr:hypothetical protein EIP86_002840 [Pleurotus ostreatoroseus]
MAKSSKRKAPASFYVHSNTVQTSNQTFELSQNQRRVKVRANTRPAEVVRPQPSTIPVTQSEPSSSSFQDATFDDSRFEGTFHQLDLSDSLHGVRVVAKEKAKRYENSDAPLKTFLTFRQDYLDETIRSEGRGDYMDVGLCPDCHTEKPTIRCKDCFGEELVCPTCVVQRHIRMPLHRVEIFENQECRPCTLSELGLVIQLGHRVGEHCVMRKERPRELVVLHTNGIHKVHAHFCHCKSDCEEYRQLLRAQWWPATPLEPHTAATFAVLRQYHYQNLQGNMTAFDFYRSLEFLTDGRLGEKLPDRQFYFGIMVREWRNIKSLKRAGRGHDPAGVAGTQPSQLVVPCRACPHPEKNLPQGWEDAPKNVSWLYRMFLAQDANFRLKARFRNTKVEDVCLSPGWGAFVEHKAYLEHVSHFANQEEISTCAGFQVLHLANLKKMRGLSATGIGGNACSRHEMWKTVGDLQKGERYCNMDYLFATTLLTVFVASIVATYDIACQFFARLWERTPTLPEGLRSAIERFKGNIVAKVPKAHIVGHILKCHGIFSLNWTRGVGRTDGEGIERLWSWLNKIASSTREMTASGRRETIDDFCNFANYRKTLALGDALLRRMLEALKEAPDHKDEYEAFDKSLRTDDLQAVEQWEKLINEYHDHEGDTGRECPYMVETTTITVQAVKLKLMAEEEKELREGRAAYSAQSGTPSAFVLLGLEIEDLQDNLKRDVSITPAANALGQTTRMERRIALWKKIEQYRKAQEFYMPGLARAIRDVEDRIGQPGWQEAEQVPLYLPSYFEDPAARATACDPKIASMEEVIREADAYESLDKLRRRLHARVFANKFKIKNVTGQRANTKARSWQKTIDQQIIESKHRYRRSRMALLALRGPGTWSETILRELTDADVRAFNERAMTLEEIREREAARRASGIQEEEIMAVPLDEGLALGEALRVEWARSKGRSERWTEEVALLWEESRRIVEFSNGLATWWDAQAARRTVTSAALREGLLVYARKQAAAERALATHWTNKLSAVRTRAEEYLRKSYLQPLVDYVIAGIQPTGPPPADAMNVEEPSQEQPHVDDAEEASIELAIEDPADDFDFDEYD